MSVVKRRRYRRHRNAIMQAARTQRHRNMRAGISVVGRSSLTNFAPLRRIMVWGEKKNLTAGVGGFLSWNMIANSMFDPSINGALATQCPGFDQLSQIYGRYRVFWSKIHLELTQVSTATAAITMMLHPGDSDTAPTTYTQAMTHPDVIWNTTDDPDRGCKPIELSMQRRTKDVISGVKNVRDSDNLQAFTSASPADKWYWYITFQSPGGGDLSTDAVLIVRCEYLVEWYSPVHVDVA